MSTTYAYIMPKYERYMPTSDTIKMISTIFANRNNGNLNVEYEINDSIQFYDCGGNFENMMCPLCNNEIDIEWWQEEMGKASEIAFSSLEIITPCCKKESSLNELKYCFPQGFSMFTVKIADYEQNKLLIDERLLFELNSISMVDWKVVYARY